MVQNSTPNAPSVQPFAFLSLGNQLIADIRTINEVKQRLHAISKDDCYGALFESDLWDADAALMQIINLMGDMAGCIVAEKSMAGEDVNL